MRGRRVGRVRAAAWTAALIGLTSCLPPYDMTADLAPGRSCPDVTETAWYFTEAAGGQDRLEDWCRTVGPPVVVEEGSADFGVLPGGGELLVVSWNGAIGRGDVVGFLEAELGLECDGSRSALAPGADHFALLLQEAFRRSDRIPESAPGPSIPRAVPEDERPGDRLDAVEVAKGCGLSLAYVPASRNGSKPRDGLREDKGVAILSTLPLEDVFFMELPYEAARRVAVAATVRDASGVPLRLANLHLISMAGPSRALRTGNASRLRQALAVADAIDRSDAAGALPVATILAGDFNTWSDRETTLLRLRESFPESPPPLGENTHGSFSTDHILFRSGAEPVSLVQASYRRLDAPYGSDHDPIRVRVRFARWDGRGWPSLTILDRRGRCAAATPIGSETRASHMTSKLTAGLIAALAGLSACQTPTDVELADLEGTWVASEVRILEIAQPKENNFDLIELGYTAVFVSDGAGVFAITLQSPEDDSSRITGTLAIDGTDVAVVTENGTGTGEVFIEDEQAALSLTGGITFDFKGDGSDVPAKLLLVMDRVGPEPL